MSHEKDFIRFCIISDLHCGHRVGLTPSKYWTQTLGDKFYKTQIALWKFYEEAIKAIQPIDILCINGDAIDGRGEKSGSSELITVSRLKQCDMAVESIKLANADKIVMTRGTPYHVGRLEEFENIIADKLGALKIEDHAWYDINGVIFDVKHKPGGSSGVPHTIGTAISMDRVWNVLWSDHNNEQPRADVIIRSHTHRFGYIGDDSWLGIYTPALQGMGSKYGAKECRALVHFGIIWFDIYRSGDYTWHRNIAKVQEHKAKTLKL